jgi:hypothetical protein
MGVAGLFAGVLVRWAAISLLAINTGWAGVVYKVTDADGRVTYSEQEPPAAAVFTTIDVPDAVDEEARRDAAVSESDKINARVDQMQAERETREKQRAELAAAQDQARLNALRVEREAVELEKARADLEAAQQPQVIIREVPMRDRDHHHHPHYPTPRPREPMPPEHIRVPDNDAFSRARAQREEALEPSEALRGSIRLPINIKKDAH